jgi:L-ascorbate metabolism protein UlaG (beta-lactamase superfamily)
MRLTKLGHSCIRLEKDGASLVIDPGIWSGPDPLAGADAILITHHHVDHLNPEVVRTALERHQELELWTTADVVEQLGDFGGRLHPVRHGDTFTAAGFGVHVYGEEHAKIYPDMPSVPNVGFLVEGNLFHPGDSFTVPDEPVRTLMLPISAPWLKASDMLDYAKAVRPQVSYGIHDELLNANGIGLVQSVADGMMGEAGPYVRLEPGASADI